MWEILLQGHILSMGGAALICLIWFVNWNRICMDPLWTWRGYRLLRTYAWCKYHWESRFSFWINWPTCAFEPAEAPIQIWKSCCPPFCSCFTRLKGSQLDHSSTQKLLIMECQGHKYSPLLMGLIEVSIEVKSSNTQKLHSTKVIHTVHNLWAELSSVLKYWSTHLHSGCPQRHNRGADKPLTARGNFWTYHKIPLWQGWACQIYNCFCIVILIMCWNGVLDYKLLETDSK